MVRLLKRMFLSRTAGAFRSQQSAATLRPARILASNFSIGSSSGHVNRWRQRAAPQGLNPDAFEPVKVIKKYNVSHDTVFVRFAYANEDAVSGLTIASCLLLSAPIGEVREDGTRETVIRPYTPVSAPDTKGHFDLVVKSYPNGTMSKHVGGLQVGDSMLVKGPIVKLPYKANMKKRVGMIAGGSGITPMIQVINGILENPDDNTEVTLLFANKTREDTLLKDYFDELATTHGNFNVKYFLSRADETESGWFTRGRVDAEAVSRHCPEPSDDHLIFVCGPPPMMESISGDKAPDKSQGPLKGVLANLGYSSHQVFKF